MLLVPLFKTHTHAALWHTHTHTCIHTVVKDLEIIQSKKGKREKKKKKGW